MASAHRGDVLGDDRWAANRIAGLNPSARRLYALILYRFTEAARRSMNS